MQFLWKIEFDHSMYFTNNIEQCKQFCNLGLKTDHTVTEYYADCRNICASWIWNPDNTPKLGGFGKIIEMDESYFAGAPKFNRGVRLDRQRHHGARGIGLDHPRLGMAVEAVGVANGVKRQLRHRGLTRGSGFESAGGQGGRPAGGAGRHGCARATNEVAGAESG